MKRIIAVVLLLIMLFIFNACMSRTNAGTAANSRIKSKQTSSYTVGATSDEQTMASESTKSQSSGTDAVDAGDLFDDTTTRGWTTTRQTSATVYGSNSAKAKAISTSKMEYDTTSTTHTVYRATTTRVLDADGDGWIDGWFRP